MILSQSLKIGVQRLKDLFATEEPLSKRARREVELFVRARAEPAFTRFKGTAYDCVVGSSGTILSLGTAVNLRRGRSPWNSPNGQIVRLDELRELANLIAEMTPEERVRVPGIDAERVDTIHIGALLLTALLEQARVDAMVLCDSALREGMVIDYLERAQEDIRAREAVPDIRRRSVLELCRRSGQAGPHADKVAMLALQIFDQTQELHQLSPLERRLLEYGALLHDVGQHIRFERHEQHSYYLIHNGELRGFTEDEIEMIALLARYHRKGRPKQRHREYAELKPKEQRIVSILSGMLRVADGLDRSHFQVVSSVSCEHNPSRLTIIVHADGDAELELWAARRKSSLLARALGLRVEVVLEESRVPTPTLS
jgi:exopolyphosphatase/guanosine-5'-triphosphate,3'-diphosphate pyrophosphatase